MPFAYYQRLNRNQKAIYRASDKVTGLRGARRQAAELSAALEADAPAAVQRQAVKRAASGLARVICDQLEVEPVKIRVLARRPRSAESELHGLYVWEQGKRAEISLWMRTAQRKQVVAFKTFLRTLLHELCHHLDYHLLELDDSFHTEGFFQRENSLARQIMGDSDKKKAQPGKLRKAKLAKNARSAKADPGGPGPEAGKSGQLDLPL